MRHFKETFVVFASTALNFLFSYAVHFFLGRFLGPVEYGKYGVVLNLAWITGIPFSAVGASFVKFSAIFNAKNEIPKVKFLLVNFLKFSFLINLLFTIGYIIFSGVLSDSLGGGINYLIIILSFSFPISGLNSLFLWLFQSLKRVYIYSILNTLSSFFKLIIIILLVLSGWGVFGALWGLVFSGLGVLFLCLPFIFKYLRSDSVKVSFKPIISFGLTVFFANFFINLVLYFDLFFVSSSLGAEQAGFYNAAVTLSRAFLMSGSVMAVFFPVFNSDFTLSNFSKLRSSVKLALLYTSLICFAGLFVFWFFSDFIVSVTYSSSFLPTVPILHVLALGYSFFSLFNVLVNALWSTGKYKITGIFGVVLFLLDIILLYFLVPIFGVMSAAWITTILLGLLFVFSLIIVFRLIKD